MGNKSSRNINDTIEWNNLNTDDMSSSIAIGGYDNLNKDAKELVSRLNTNFVKKESISYNNDNNQVFQKNYNNLNSKTDYSKTSPFISSEMYNYLLENSSSSNLEEVQKGGRLETSSTDLESNNSSVNIDKLSDSSLDLIGGDDSDENTEDDHSDEHDKKEKKDDDEEEDEDDENEDESKKKEFNDSLVTTDNDLVDEAGNVNETSDNQELETAESMVDTEEETLENNHNEDKDDDEEENDNDELEEDDEEEQMGGAFGYTSSSAHSNESSEYDTTISVGNNKVLSDSINTSDINMVSVDN